MGAAILQQNTDHVTLFRSRDQCFCHVTASHDHFFEQNGGRLLVMLSCHHFAQFLGVFMTARRYPCPHKIVTTLSEHR